MDADEVVAVYEPLDQLEASAIQQALEDEGIWSHLEGENQSALAGAGFLGNAGRWRMRLLVRAGDAERVKEIIEGRKWPRSG